MEFVSLEKEMLKMGHEIVKKAQLGLATQRTRTSYKATWKNGQPTSVKTSKYKGNINSSKALSNSLTPIISHTSNGSPILEIDGLSYGVVVNDGIRGRIKNTSLEFGPQRQPPQAEMRKWVEKKPLKLRDLESGQFVKINRESINNAAYLISRKIKFFGKEPTLFMDNAMEKVLAKWIDKLAEALAEDVANDLLKRLEI